MAGNTICRALLGAGFLHVWPWSRSSMARRVLIRSSHGSRTSRTCRKSMWCNRPTLPALWRFPLTSSRLSTWKLMNGVAFGKQSVCNINRCGLRKWGSSLLLSHLPRSRTPGSWTWVGQVAPPARCCVVAIVSCSCSSRCL